MKRVVLAFTFFFLLLCVNAQRIQTIVPGQVVIGNAFQLQYIINDPSAFIEINTPQFDDLQLISGPNYYKGNSLVSGKAQAIENITYTVVPLKTGIIKINPVTARFKNNEEEKSDKITINVLPQPKASFNTFSTYTDINLYAPSSKTDLAKLVNDNLFVKTEVDKKSCFLGEAITASFKLYSRLQSTSEVINAPSLYGFSVMDILNINEAHQAVETINGKIFNTSILRKLQLYPAQTGRLLIDEMQLQNSIEFNDSATGKKMKVEKLLASNPVEVLVKSLPTNQPTDYSEAVGEFSVSAELAKSKIAANTQGKLFVTITGKGNFIQFGPPVINWPKGFDVFDPLVSDELNKNTVPEEGKRKYIFSFTTDQTGSSIIPPVAFSFFDPLSGGYKTVRTDSLRFEIAPVKLNANHSSLLPKIRDGKNPWFYFVGIALLAVVSLFLFLRRKQKNSVLPVSKTNYPQKLSAISSEELTDKEFCSAIQKLLNEAAKEHNLSGEQNAELLSIQKECELLVYSDISSEGKKEEIQKRAGDLLKQFTA